MGTAACLRGDNDSVRCEQCREALSARLDGADDAVERAAVDAHLAGCAACRRWSHDAAAVTRLARMSVVAGDPVVSNAVLGAAPGPGRRRLAHGLRVALGVLGVAQFLLGIAQVGAIAVSQHDHASGTSGVAHLWHESAAWNVAIGAGFGWVAVRRSRPAGLIPVLSVFVGLLALLSANDVWLARVDPTRLASHALVVLGYLVVVALSRPSFDFGDPPPARLRPPWGGRVGLDDDVWPGPAQLRAVSRHLPQQSARLDRAA